MEAIKIVVDEGAFVPTRAHKTDAGLDLYCKEHTRIWAGHSAIFDTGVHIEMPHGYFGKIESKSGLNINHSIVSHGGVVDEGYTGSIKVKLYNHGSSYYDFERGDKIAQLVLEEYLAPELEVVSHLNETERGSQGFGSSGK